MTTDILLSFRISSVAPKLAPCYSLVHTRRIQPSCALSQACRIVLIPLSLAQKVSINRPLLSTNSSSFPTLQTALMHPCVTQTAISTQGISSNRFFPDIGLLAGVTTTGLNQKIVFDAIPKLSKTMYAPCALASSLNVSSLEVAAPPPYCSSSRPLIWTTANSRKIFCGKRGISIHDAISTSA